MLVSHELEAVQFGCKSEVSLTLFDSGGHDVRVHLLEVQASVERAEGIARWGSDDPVRVKFSYKSACPSAILSAIEIPIFSIRTWST